MVLKIDAEPSDTLLSCATKASAVAALLNINVNFYFDRVGFWVSPGESAASVIARIKAKQARKIQLIVKFVPKKIAEPKSKK